MLTRPKAQSDLALLTIAAWPRAWSPAQRMTALASAVGIEPVAAEVIARNTPPVMAGFAPRDVAREQARALRTQGVPSLVIDLATLRDRDTQRVRAKRLVPALGAPEPMYLVEPWDRRLPNLPLLMSDVRLIVRGQVQITESGRPLDMGPDLVRRAVLGHEEIVTELAEETTAPSTPARVIEAGELIDLHRDGLAPIRIDGRKFNYDVLGPARAMTDRVNADRLALRLAEEAKQAQVDLGFAAWRPPRLMPLPAQPPGGKRNEGPLFDFYSVWLGTVEQALREARSARSSQSDTSPSQ